jgi:DNA invertase Pin-like site-specific DNA recombinase
MKQRSGIEKAQQDNKYSGRKKISFSIPLLHELSEKTDKGELTVDVAAKTLHISRRTLYRRLEELKKY